MDESLLSRQKEEGQKKQIEAEANQAPPSPSASFFLRRTKRTFYSSAAIMHGNKLPNQNQLGLWGFGLPEHEKKTNWSRIGQKKKRGLRDGYLQTMMMFEALHVNSSPVPSSPCAMPATRPISDPVATRKKT